MENESLAWISKRVENLRECKGISAREMSRGINKEETYIRQVETGKIIPSITVLSLICQYLGISIKDFFDDEVENPESLNYLIKILRPLGKREIESITSITELISENRFK